MGVVQSPTMSKLPIQKDRNIAMEAMVDTGVDTEDLADMGVMVVQSPTMSKLPIQGQEYRYGGYGGYRGGYGRFGGYGRYGRSVTDDVQAADTEGQEYRYGGYGGYRGGYGRFG